MLIMKTRNITRDWAIFAVKHFNAAKAVYKKSAEQFDAGNFLAVGYSESRGDALMKEYEEAANSDFLKGLSIDQIRELAK